MSSRRDPGRHARRVANQASAATARGIHGPTQSTSDTSGIAAIDSGRVDTEDQPQSQPLRGELPRLSPVEIDAFVLGSGDIDARDVKAQEAAEGCAEYERPQEYRQYR